MTDRAYGRETSGTSSTRPWLFSLGDRARYPAVVQRKTSLELPFERALPAPQASPSSRVVEPEGGVTLEREPLTVAALDRLLRGAVETASRRSEVEGEVVGLKAAPSGHLYFGLRDPAEDALIDCVMYRSAAQSVRRFLVDGATVVLRGQATVYAPRGRLQYIAEAARLSGEGARLVALEKLKAALAAEGLFDMARKRPLPSDPHTVGLVTSRDGAAVHDVAKVAFRRGTVRFLLSPTLVQGTSAPVQIVAALERLEALDEVDVIVLTRGGGSAEDLAAFNDERVVRKVAACRVPVISAVGHEVDITLTDLAADVRAATPSQAGELLVASEHERRQVLGHLTVRIRQQAERSLTERRASLAGLERELRDVSAWMGHRGQQLDDLSQRLRSRGEGLRYGHRSAFAQMERRLLQQHPRTVLARGRARWLPLATRLEGLKRDIISRPSGELRELLARLESLSPRGALARGYALLMDGQGRAIRNAGEVEAGDAVTAQLGTGALSLVVTGRTS